MADQVNFLDVDKHQSWDYYFWWAWPCMPLVPKINLRYLSNISRKRVGINSIFCIKLSTKVFHKLILLLLLVITRYAQSTQNKFAIYLQHLKEVEGHEVASNIQFCERDKSFPIFFVLARKDFSLFNQISRYSRSVWLIFEKHAL